MRLLALLLSAATAMVGGCVGDSPGSPSPPPQENEGGVDSGSGVDDAGWPEESDAAADAPITNDDGGDAAIAARKRVFVTSIAVDGRLGGNGVISADQTCQTRALAASLGGTFRAWISTGNEDAIARVRDVPYYLVDRVTLVQTSRSALGSGGLVNAIGMDEKGDLVPPGTLVWTGTKSNGKLDAFHCNKWDVAGGATDGQVGAADETTGAWTAKDAQDCSSKNRLYCFEY